MKGLTSIQAEQFLKQYGLNIISGSKKKHFLIKLFEQFNDFLTLLLLLAAIFSFLIHEPIDGILIVAIVVLNAFFGLYQEAKAEESLKVLQKMTITKVRVIRDGVEQEIDSRYLVPGDVVHIEEGTKIPADGRVLESINLEINEAILTGESLPVDKKVKDELFSGTIVSRGRGLFEIAKTGMNTKFGSIAKSLSTIDDSATPLQKKLADLTRIIGIVGIFLAIIVFIISLIEGSGYFPSFLLAISLAVAIVPEGLPAVMTITLAIGMKTMATKKAIIRKLSAIEALGSITLIATDKTGTLTTNKMQVKEIYINNETKSEITNLKSQIKNLNEKTFNSLDLLLLNGVLCSTASLVYIHDHGSWDVLGDPTEGALLYLVQKTNQEVESLRKQWKLIEEQPFDSVTKMMTVEVKRQSLNSKGQKYIFSKGAPESIIDICDKIMIGEKVEELQEERKKIIKKQVSLWAGKGLRVLAFSFKNSKLNIKNLQKDNIFLGMVAIHDAPRPEVRAAVEKAHRAGIRVVMVTGDNEKTAEAVGVSSGFIKDGDEILTGVQIDRYSDEELKEVLPRVKIFARTNPFQKHRIVKLFQELGEIVAVTGDGVNDAIALKQADVGVAMGLVGTDVARETADMVITDDNFATIVTAVEEGRNIINSLKNAIKYLLSCNVSEAIALIIGLILGLPTLFYPIQLLYINLVTDGLPALMLSFSPRDPHLMDISPQKEMVLLKKKDQNYILSVGFLGAVIVIFSFFVYKNIGLGKTAAFSVLTMIQSFVFIDLWLSHRHIHEHLRHLISPFFILAFIIPLSLQFIILSNSFSATIFKVESVSYLVFFELFIISFFVLIGIRLIKKIIHI